MDRDFGPRQSPWILCVNKCGRPDNIPQRVRAGWAGRAGTATATGSAIFFIFYFFKATRAILGPIIHGATVLMFHYAESSH